MSGLWGRSWQCDKGLHCWHLLCRSLSGRQVIPLGTGFSKASNRCVPLPPTPWHSEMRFSFHSPNAWISLSVTTSCKEQGFIAETGNSSPSENQVVFISPQTWNNALRKNILMLLDITHRSTSECANCGLTVGLAYWVMLRGSRGTFPCCTPLRLLSLS